MFRIVERHREHVRHRLDAAHLDVGPDARPRAEDDDAADAQPLPPQWHHEHRANAVLLVERQRFGMQQRLARGAVQVGDGDRRAALGHARDGGALGHEGASDERRRGAARGGDAQLAVVLEDAEISALDTLDVGEGVHEALQHTVGLQFGVDLVAELPHAMQHALRLGERDGALRDERLKRGAQLLLGEHALLELARSAFGTRRDALQHEQAERERDEDQLDRDAARYP